MTDGIMISIGDDGVARMYDDTYDITIHCESKEEQDEAMKMLRAERKKGKWIEVDDAPVRCYCSCCGWQAYMYEDDVVGMPYCPNCGAKMEGENDENQD